MRFLWTQDGEGAVYEVTAPLRPNSRSSLLSLRAGHTVVAIGLSLMSSLQPAQEFVEGSHPTASSHCRWEEVNVMPALGPDAW